ncbi:hypothetical protein KGM_207812 [Danaus plexippus plexippus]|uniref:Uncharacterized protein n=1 Tax=Danaus plexippus plexippus TaxID=278856 RepID=A0A212FK15_DANPL|nr:hypothetical protein KGM_207812 [Danaus plexippus plexippus]
MTAKNRQLDWRRAHWRVGEGKRPRRRTVRETPIFQSTACSVRRPQAQAAPPYNDSDPNGAPAQSVPCARHVETRPDAAPRPPLSVTVVRYQYENRTVSEQRSCCHIRLTFQDINNKFIISINRIPTLQRNNSVSHKTQHTRVNGTPDASAISDCLRDAPRPPTTPTEAASERNNYFNKT